MSKSVLPKDDSLKKLQGYVRQVNTERGFNSESQSEKLTMLVEEVGELARSIRKSVGMKFADTTRRAEFEDELADVQLVLLDLANMNNIDMFDAVIEKEKKNRKRTWK